MAGTFNPLRSAAISCSTVGNNTIIAASSGKAIKVYKMFFVVDSGVSITFYDSTTTAMSGAMKFVGNQGIVLDMDGNNDPQPWFNVTPGNAFVFNLSDAVQVSGTIYYTQE